MIWRVLVALDADPTLGEPGWPAFLVVTLLALVMVGLYFSMRKQFRKINVPPSDEEHPSAGPEDRA